MVIEGLAKGKEGKELDPEMGEGAPIYREAPLRAVGGNDDHGSNDITNCKQMSSEPHQEAYMPKIYRLNLAPPLQKGGGMADRKDDAVRVGGNIKALRERLEMTTREFAAGVPGLRSSNLSEIERGIRRLTMPMLDGICRKYRVTADSILIGATPEKDSTLRPVVRLVPLLSWAAAAEWLEAGCPAGVVGDEYIPTATDYLRAAYVMGPDVGLEGRLKYLSGSYLLVAPEAEVENDSIILVTGPGDYPLRVRLLNADGKTGGMILTGGASVNRFSAAERKAAKMIRVVQATKQL